MTFSQASQGSIAKVLAAMEAEGRPAQWAIGSLVQCSLTGELGEVVDRLADYGPFLVEWSDCGARDWMASAALRSPRS